MMLSMLSVVIAVAVIWIFGGLVSDLVVNHTKADEKISEKIENQVALAGGRGRFFRSKLTYPSELALIRHPILKKLPGRCAATPTGNLPMKLPARALPSSRTTESCP